MGVLKTIGLLLRALVVPRAALVAENLALRQQLAVLKPSVKRPKLRLRDMAFWVWPSFLADQVLAMDRGNTVRYRTT